MCNSTSTRARTVAHAPRACLPPAGSHEAPDVDTLAASGTPPALHRRTRRSNACKRASPRHYPCASTHTMLARRTLGGCHHRATVTVRAGCMGMVALPKMAHTHQRDLHMAATEVPTTAAPTAAPPMTRAPTAPPTFSPAGDPIGMPRAAAHLAGPVAVLRAPCGAASAGGCTHQGRTFVPVRARAWRVITYFVQSCVRVNAGAVHGA